MPTYSVAQSRSQNFSLKGEERSATVDFSADFLVTVTLGTGESISDVNAYSVATANGLPKVNESAYDYGGIIMPYVICRELNANPMDGSFLLWKVNAKYKTLQGTGTQFATSSISTLASIPAQVEYSASEHEEVLYEDFTTPNAVNCATTPAKNWWSEPVVTKIALEVKKVSQFEAAWQAGAWYTDIYKTNDATYDSGDAGTWLLTNVDATNVSIPVGGVSTQATLWTYTMMYNSEGWTEKRALLDTQYLDANGNVILFQNDVPGSTAVGYINADGTKRGAANGGQSGIPSYIEYKVFEELDFSFLQA